MSITNLKKVSTYTRMGCDNFALDFSYKILYTTLIFIYKNLNITFKHTCSWQYKNATASSITRKEKNAQARCKKSS